jgi:hypothetical protein
MTHTREQRGQHRRERERRSAQVAGARPSVAAVLGLQATAGNQAVGRMLARRCPFKRREPEPAAQPEAVSEPAPVAEPVPAAPVEEPEPEGPSLVPTVKVEPVREQRAFKSCEEARAWADVNLGQSNTEARVPPIGSPTLAIGERDGQVTASVALDFKVDPTLSSMRLVEPVWPDMTEDEKEEVKAYVAAMHAHENGHIAVAEQAYAAMSGVVEGVGATEAEARAAWLANAKDKLAATTGYVDYKGEEYDALTQHGRRQSELDGVNTTLSCPPRPAP